MAKLPKPFVEVEKLMIFAQVWEHQKGKLETFVLCSFIPPSSEEYRMVLFTGERCTVLFQRFIVTNIIWECALLPMEKELFHDVLYFLFWCSWSCWMQEAWVGHSFSYKLSKNYSVDVSSSHIELVSPTVESTNSYSNVCHLYCFSLLSMIPGILQVKGRWLAGLGLKVYTKQGVWTVFLCPNPFTGTKWHNKPYFHRALVFGRA